MPTHADSTSSRPSHRQTSSHPAASSAALAAAAVARVAEAVGGGGERGEEGVKVAALVRGVKECVLLGGLHRARVEEDAQRFGRLRERAHLAAVGEQRDEARGHRLRRLGRRGDVEGGAAEERGVVVEAEQYAVEAAHVHRRQRLRQRRAAEGGAEGGEHAGGVGGAVEGGAFDRVGLGEGAQLSEQPPHLQRPALDRRRRRRRAAAAAAAAGAAAPAVATGPGGGGGAAGRRPTPPPNLGGRRRAIA